MELNKESERLELANEAKGANSAILLEGELRQLGRSLPGLILQQGNANQQPSAQVQQLRLDLLHTAKSSRLSPSHGAAALNALCAFLDICSKFQNDAWTSLCFSPATCKDLFHIFLDRAEIFKAKPVRQLLVTLSKILADYPNDDVKSLLIDSIVARCVRSLSKKEDAKSVKSCIQALEHFMKKGIITAGAIVFASTRDVSATPQIDEKIILDYGHPTFREAVEDFVTEVLSWARYPDCASAISRFLPYFFVSLDKVLVAKAPERNSTRNDPKSPLWIRPVKRFLKRDIGIIDSFEIHVLPGLLRLSLWDRESFFATLPLDELQQGNVGGQTHADITLCLLTAKVMNSNFQKSGVTWPPILSYAF